MTIEAIESLEQTLPSRGSLKARQHLAVASYPLYSLALTLAGVAGLLALWQLGGWLVAAMCARRLLPDSRRFPH